MYVITPYYVRTGPVKALPTVPGKKSRLALEPGHCERLWPIQPIRTQEIVMVDPVGGVEVLNSVLYFMYT